MRSARIPAAIPPAADATRVAELTSPASAFDRPNSARMVCSANTYSSTSIASSMNPSMAAQSAIHRGSLVTRFTVALREWFTREGKYIRSARTAGSLPRLNGG